MSSLVITWITKRIGFEISYEKTDKQTRNKNPTPEIAVGVGND